MLDTKNLPVYTNPNIKIKVKNKKTKYIDSLYKSNILKHSDFGSKFLENYFKELNTR